MKNLSTLIIFISSAFLTPSWAWAMPALAQAERLFDEGLYEDALALYSELNKHDPSPDLQWRLAQVYYELGRYAEVIELAAEFVPSNSAAKGHSEIIYIKALAYLHLDEVESGQNTLRAYLALGNGTSLLHHAEALFELGKITFPLETAKESFIALTQQHPSSHLIPPARSYLGRLAFLQGNRQEAQELFQTLQKTISKTDPLYQEAAYWLGRVHMGAGDYVAATGQFDQVKEGQWLSDALYHTGCCYLKLAENVHLTKEEQMKSFNQAEKAWTQLAAAVPEESSFLALGELYLKKARRFDDAEAYQAAERILERQELFISPYAQAKALLMRAEAAPSYSARDSLYRQLTQEQNSTNPLYPEGWHMRGLNDFQEGQRLSEQGLADEAKKLFAQAAPSLEQASLLFESAASPKADMARKYQALALFHTHHEGSIQESRHLINQLLTRDGDKSELYYLSGLIASHLTEDDPLSLAEKSLKEGIDRYPRGSFAPESFHLLALLYYNNGRPAEAESLFLALAKQFPESPLAGEAWYWAACCAESLEKEESVIKQYKKTVFEKYPLCHYAAEAYLSTFPYRDYLQGERTALKHLELMPTRFSHSPLVINAYYLMGLDRKKDHLSLEGKLVRQKNLLAAIDAFQEGESAFDAMYEQNQIPADQIAYFATLRYRSTLERALSNLAIAEESQGAKRRIYLEYAEEVFKQVVDDFTNGDHLLSQKLLQGEPYHRLWEESEFWLAHTYIQRGNDADADKLLTQMIERYQQANITKGYFLARTWIEKGLIARRRDACKAALESFALAEDAAKGKVLSTDQRLDLWIQQSLCYKDLKQYEQAMRLLSKVINDDAISGMRLKAMFLRADLYELQGRPELAIKQLEATAKKGGEWGKKAEALLKTKK